MYFYADLESLNKKVDCCKSIPEKSSTTKVDWHIPFGYLMPALWSFDGIENRHDVYRGEDCTKKSCESFREHTSKIINFEKKKMIPLTNEQQELYENTKIYYICKKIIKHKYTNDKTYWKVKDRKW